MLGDSLLYPMLSLLHEVVPLGRPSWKNLAGSSLLLASSEKLHDRLFALCSRPRKVQVWVLGVACRRYGSNKFVAQVDDGQAINVERSSNTFYSASSRVNRSYIFHKL